MSLETLKHKRPLLKRLVWIDYALTGFFNQVAHTRLNGHSLDGHANILWGVLRSAWASMLGLMAGVMGVSITGLLVAGIAELFLWGLPSLEPSADAMRMVFFAVAVLIEALALTGWCRLKWLGRRRLTDPDKQALDEVVQLLSRVAAQGDPSVTVTLGPSPGQWATVIQRSEESNALVEGSGDDARRTLRVQPSEHQSAAERTWVHKEGAWSDEHGRIDEGPAIHGADFAVAHIYERQPASPPVLLGLHRQHVVSDPQTQPFSFEVAATPAPQPAVHPPHRTKVTGAAGGNIAFWLTATPFVSLWAFIAVGFGFIGPEKLVSPNANIFDAMVMAFPWWILAATLVQLYLNLPSPTLWRHRKVRQAPQSAPVHFDGRWLAHAQTRIDMEAPFTANLYRPPHEGDAGVVLELRQSSARLAFRLPVETTNQEVRELPPFQTQAPWLDVSQARRIMALVRGHLQLRGQRWSWSLHAAQNAAEPVETFATQTATATVGV